MSSSPAPLAPMPRAPGLAARNACVLLALLPGIAILVYFEGASLLRRAALAIAVALATEAIALRLRRLPALPYLREGSAALLALLLVLWLPALEGWRLAAATFFAVALARQAFGGLGEQPFHPAMAGAAFAMLALAVPSSTSTAMPSAWLAAAWALGGLALLALRLLRWQAPVAMLAGVAIATLATGAELASIDAAPWMLAAVFIVPEPASGCEHARARLVFAFACGLLAVLASPAGRADALPFAVLAMNALAPALDAWLAPRRRAQAAR